ncbi:MULTISPECIES: hypothetical protein [Paraburkholderia]|uniref:hypothetical protein n=1 Tax=Paraburkholderia TaxID=1822464 RepID=UPI0022556268|nr:MULTISPECIES: hypothetical protein [Paraburkholderia]MCX4164126.1 hypothetical protein [Paraburkholderia megapolitana]MDN7159620.1 hypothetical protein [Paraburkholderia sp. CHISQ3]MDQ6496667.1 hypothetical protein [Paraburkholderia megapolitana]
MNVTISDKVTSEDSVAIAQISLYLFAILQVVVALMMAGRVCPLGAPLRDSTTQRMLTTTNAVVDVLCLPVGGLLLVWCLNRWIAPVWRIALSVFLLNSGVAAQAIVAQPNSYPAATCTPSVADAMSVGSRRE